MTGKRKDIDWIDASRISVATPCHVDWDTMSGDERKRFCGNCKKNVYNLSDMPEKEATSFISKEVGAGRVPCIQFYQREDGTILFDNCPVALRKVRDAARRTFKVVASLVSLCLSVATAIAAPSSSAQSSKAGAAGKSATGAKPDPVKAVRDLVKEQELANSKSGAALNDAPTAPKNAEKKRSGPESEGWLRGDYMDPKLVSPLGKKVTIIPGCSSDPSAPATDSKTPGASGSGESLPVKGEMYIPPAKKPGAGSTLPPSAPVTIAPPEIVPSKTMVQGQFVVRPVAKEAPKEPKQRSD